MDKQTQDDCAVDGTGSEQRHLHACVSRFPLSVALLTTLLFAGLCLAFDLKRKASGVKVFELPCNDPLLL